jgi:hypothetical protein
MQTITTIGSDIAKSVYQVHGVDAGGALGAKLRGIKEQCGQRSCEPH